MDLFTEEEREQLLDNGRRSAAGEDIDPVPPVLLAMSDSRARWLITEIDPEQPDMAYGLVDLGIGLPECGSVSLSELAAMTGPARMPVGRSRSYRPSPDLPLSRLDRMASEVGRIVV